jgi:hypothetical protein
MREIKITIDRNEKKDRNRKRNMMDMKKLEMKQIQRR